MLLRIAVLRAVSDRSIVRKRMVEFIGRLSRLRRNGADVQTLHASAVAELWEFHFGLFTGFVVPDTRHEDIAVFFIVLAHSCSLYSINLLLERVN